MTPCFKKVKLRFILCLVLIGLTSFGRAHTNTESSPEAKDAALVFYNHRPFCPPGSRPTKECIALAIGGSSATTCRPTCEISVQDDMLSILTSNKIEDRKKLNSASLDVSVIGTSNQAALPCLKSSTPSGRPFFAMSTVDARSHVRPVHPPIDINMLTKICSVTAPFIEEAKYRPLNYTGLIAAIKSLKETPPSESHSSARVVPIPFPGQDRAQAQQDFWDGQAQAMNATENP